MRNFVFKKQTLVWGLMLSALFVAGEVQAKSVYLAANHHTRQFDAWALNPDGTVTYQSTYNLQYSTDPAGIAIDAVTGTGNPLMFISSEFSGGVEIIDPVTLTYIGVSSGPRNLAGVDVDDVDNVIYALLRGRNTLYIYTYNDDGTGVTQQAAVNLPGMSGGFGLAFDDTRDILWVTDYYGYRVRAYDVTDWSNITERADLTVTVVHRPIDVAMDRVRNIVYTVGGYAGSPYLSKVDVGTGVEEIINLGVGGVGCAVEETTGYVYLTRGTSSAGDDVQVWDTSTSPFTLVQDTPRIGNPAGLAIANVSYNPLNLAKNDVIEGTGIAVGSEFTYEISSDNLLNTTDDAEDVIIIDTLPGELDFVSATDGGVYDPAQHIVTWDVGIIPAGGSGPDIDLVVRVNDGAVPGQTVHNYCTIQYTIAGQETETTVVDDEGSEDPDDEEGTPIIAPQPSLCADVYRWSLTHLPPFEWAPYPIIFIGWTDAHFVNSGEGDAYNVVATITCVPSNVTIYDGEVVLGDIPAGESAWSIDAFGLAVDMTVPSDPDQGITWRVEYDDSEGVHHVVEGVPEFCGGYVNCP